MGFRERDLAEIRRLFGEMGAWVERMVAMATEGLLARRVDLIEEVVIKEEDVNYREVEIDRACVRFIALYQPEASLLRTVVVTMRMNPVLERIGDHAYNMAREAEGLLEEELPERVLDEIGKMSAMVRGMLRDGIRAYMEEDPRLGRAICQRDDEVDAMRDQLIGELVGRMREEPAFLRRGLSLIQIIQNLERIGDLATNLGEDAVYMATGSIIKHHLENSAREEGKTP